MKLNYRTYNFQKKSELLGPYIKRPVIEIALVHEGQSIPCVAIIDSGADVSIFPADIGEQLGIDVRSGEPGFSGGMSDISLGETFLHRITLKIGGSYYSTVVGFSYEPTRRNYGILGQRGFFDLFIVRFDLAREEIELTANR